jgi:hypothetical protein
MLHQIKSDDGVFIKLDNCLCECYMETESDDDILLSSCSRIVYIKSKAMMVCLSSWRIVYVNVTSNQKR